VWGKEWLVETREGERVVPAMEFLRSIPVGPRVQLLAIVESVCTTGPDQWKDEQSHRAMKGNLADLHEARDKHGETLYRLFLKWQRDERRVVLLDGRTKPNQTTLDDADYAEIRRVADLIIPDPPPFAVADDFAAMLIAADEPGIEDQT
jgi:hypothetical protein